MMRQDIFHIPINNLSFPLRDKGLAEVIKIGEEKNE
ncbi:hypothetical protein ES708_02651 [subsurface metagenome]